MAARGIAIGGQASPETPTPTPARSLPRTDKLSLADLEAGARASRAQAEAYAPEPMSIERFAEIQAALTKSRDRDGVLAFYGLALQQWRTVVEQMGNAMNESPALKAQYEQHYRKALQHGR
ncbi:MAG: hypothetical protein HOV80_07480 [Polyangiaceae bacterium]|nr:hypothetical protein [Polyangiaceae bacterium]